MTVGIAVMMMNISNAEPPPQEYDVLVYDLRLSLRRILFVAFTVAILLNMYIERRQSHMKAWLLILFLIGAYQQML
jgi:hypothetical protein